MSLLLLASNVHAQESVRVRPPSVTAQGEAVIIAEPDQAQIDIGVLTQARTAPDAAKENADKLSRVLAEIKKLLGKGDEVKTTGYTLNPNYRYPQGGKPEITGYTATNILQIRTGNLQGVGKLIDAGMQSGANQINRLVFTLKDEHSAQLQALRMAAQKAQSKAEEMAGALGLKVVRVLSLIENDYSPDTRHASGSAVVRRTDTGRGRHHRGALVSDLERRDRSALSADIHPEQQHSAFA
jgi:uncharacterized protein YggE